MKNTEKLPQMHIMLMLQILMETEKSVIFDDGEGQRVQTDNFPNCS